jgi:hypothetical protein
MLPVEELPSRHHQVAHRQKRGQRQRQLGHDLHQQPSTRTVNCLIQNVGDDRAGDTTRQLVRRVHRQHASEAHARSTRERLSYSRLACTDKCPWRPASKVVDPVVGVRSELDLYDPRPKPARGRVDRNAAPGHQRRRAQPLVARKRPRDLAVRDAPPVADHILNTDTSNGGAYSCSRQPRNYRASWRHLCGTVPTIADRTLSALRGRSEKLPKSMSKRLSTVRRTCERATPTNPKD